MDVFIHIYIYIEVILRGYDQEILYGAQLFIDHVILCVII